MLAQLVNKMEPVNNSEIVFVVIVCFFMVVLVYMLHNVPKPYSAGPAAVRLCAGKGPVIIMADVSGSDFPLTDC